MSEAPPPPDPDTGERPTVIFFVIVTVLAAAGYVIGIRNPAEPARHQSPEGAAAGGALAPNQAGVEAARYRARGIQHQAGLAALGNVTLPAAERSEEAFEAALARRASRRAYAGAPPTIPHPVDAMETPSCLSCHAEGAVIEGRVAAPISHEPYASCTQCHVPENGRQEEAGPRLPAFVSEVNTFAGLDSPGHGPSAWPGAPPQAPHPFHMREDCTSCHGPLGGALSSSHLERAFLHPMPCVGLGLSGALRPRRRGVARREVAMSEKPHVGRRAFLRGRFRPALGGELGRPSRDPRGVAMPDAKGLEAPRSSPSSQSGRGPSLPQMRFVARVVNSQCLGSARQICGTCVERCPRPGALRMEGLFPIVDANQCDGCGECERLCPAPSTTAIRVLPALPEPGR